MFNLKEKKVIGILKNGGVGVMPTDTIYGLVGSAFSKQAVDRIYKIKNRDTNKPLIVLISSVKDLEEFSITNVQSSTLNKFWPGKVSIILPCTSPKFRYLHRGTKSIAFRLPAKKSLIEILKKTGPLVAPSANPESLKPAENIKQAKKYFTNGVDFYLSVGILKNESSTLIKVDKSGGIEILRGIIK